MEVTVVVVPFLYGEIWFRKLMVAAVNVNKRKEPRTITILNVVLDSTFKALEMEYWQMLCFC